jgi:hypothetical protein
MSSRFPRAGTATFDPDIVVLLVVLYHQGHGVRARTMMRIHPATIHHVELKPMKSVRRRGSGRSWYQRRPRSFAAFRVCGMRPPPYPNDEAGAATGPSGSELSHSVAPPSDGMCSGAEPDI